MKYLKDFKNKQRIAYLTLYNAFKNNKQSHVYLISGEKGSMLKESALLIAKSFVCENDILCCEECNDCKRIDNNSYTDVKLINFNNEGISVEDFENLQSEFAISAFEKKKIKIYIINLIENAEEKATNKLLKFIEEPSNDIYGIITTQNIEKVLPTIKSRCQIIKLVEDDKEIIMNELRNNGISEDDCYILSKFNNSVENCLEFIKDRESYDKIKNLSVDTLNHIFNDIDNLIYFVQTNVYPLITKFKNDNRVILYMEILCIYIMDLLLDRKNNLCPAIINFNNKKVLESLLSKLMLAEGRIDSNLNKTLMLDKLFIEIYKEMKGE